MHLRALQVEDAPYMLEWMHDYSVVKDLQADFMSKTLSDCCAFIRHSQSDTDNLNLAIADDQNIYMGTVSLKHIKSDCAEMAIVVRKSAMGKGFSAYAIHAIAEVGFEKKGLSYIYWCVSPNNQRAIRFYNKNGFERFDVVGLGIDGYSAKQIDEYLWYKKSRG